MIPVCKHKNTKIIDVEFTDKTEKRFFPCYCKVNETQSPLIGTCKECLFKVPINETTRIKDTPKTKVKLFDEEVELPECKDLLIWECPECFYPNNMGDFWYVGNEVDSQ